MRTRHIKWIADQHCICTSSAGELDDSPSLLHKKSSIPARPLLLCSAPETGRECTEMACHLATACMETSECYIEVKHDVTHSLTSTWTLVTSVFISAPMPKVPASVSERRRLVAPQQKGLGSDMDMPGGRSRTAFPCVKSIRGKRLRGWDHCLAGLVQQGGRFFLHALSLLKVYLKCYISKSDSCWQISDITPHPVAVHGFSEANLD